MGDWKPGDVAIAAGARVVFVTCDDDEVRWVNPHGFKYRTSALSPDARPLVVIDPEDREQVERLAQAYLDKFGGNLAAVAIADQMQAALREFADPTPTRIDEPGICGVVEASCVHSDIRLKWLRQARGEWYPLNATTGADDWDSLIDPVLVREGVEE